MAQQGTLWKNNKSHMIHGRVILSTSLAK
jgi:hypothetical protein